MSAIDGPALQGSSGVPVTLGQAGVQVNALLAGQGVLQQQRIGPIKAGARVLLLGMQMPPNYGADYSRRFAALYAQVAQTEKTALAPFFLRGVADVADAERWFQSDRIHPNAQAQTLMLNNVWPELKKLL